jgi:hypothetical protein
MLGLALRKADSSFSEEKEAKRLLSIGSRGPIETFALGHEHKCAKVFCFFFSKKKTLSS